jgi:hypothetical protein
MNEEDKLLEQQNQAFLEKKQAMAALLSNIIGKIIQRVLVVYDKRGDVVVTVIFNDGTSLSLNTEDDIYITYGEEENYTMGRDEAWIERPNYNEFLSRNTNDDVILT